MSFFKDALVFVQTLSELTSKDSSLGVLFTFLELFLSFMDEFMPFVKARKKKE